MSILSPKDKKNSESDDTVKFHKTCCLQIVYHGMYLSKRSENGLPVISDSAFQNTEDVLIVVQKY